MQNMTKNTYICSNFSSQHRLLKGHIGVIEIIFSVQISQV